MNFANLKFRDVFSELNAGFPPAIYAAGSPVGSALLMTGRDKMVFHHHQGSGGAGSSRLILYAASISTGVGSTSIGMGSPLYASATSAAGGVAVTELRGEHIADLDIQGGSTGLWVFPVLSVAGASVVAAVQANGFVETYVPASYNDAPATGYVLGESDLF
jgi:hypothetical protein